MDPFNLPKNFLFGTATSGFQIEGNNNHSSWHDWINSGHIKNYLKNQTFCDHWNRIDEDIGLIKKLNSKTYRMGLEWSRIEPKEGIFDKEVIEHYIYEIKKIKDNKIKPLVTLHHFSNPVWFENKGGWLNKRGINYFLNYTGYIVDILSDYVQDWITINEPNIYLGMGYLKGYWPPGKKLALFKYLHCAQNMITAHRKAYNIIHETGIKKNVMMNVGVAHHIRNFKPLNKNIFNKKIIQLLNYYFHDLFLDHMTVEYINKKSDKNIIKEKYADFLGINYYTMDTIGISFNLHKKSSDSEIKNNLGWEVYPEGLFDICSKYYLRYNLPIYITENGICDNNDSMRIKFIYDHVFQIKKLIDAGINIQRYYHWSLIDNFEWLEGLKARFGLIHIDYNTLKRTIKKSGFFYSELSRNNLISKEMIKKYNLIE